MIDYNEVIVCCDQPVVCPICGARTEIIVDMSHTNTGSQIHNCLAAECDYEFVVVTDNELNRL